MKKMYSILLLVCIILITFILLNKYHVYMTGKIILGVSAGFAVSSIMNIRRYK
ncbi:hypothetical protein QOZ84_02520 [Romboutsia sedimentorum]|uniref:Uncharacterized protein n=1 Tax=Romboutsia sedimentorum TaxID=1368474 RepID=A0ABT7E656_9FIRM|nr:hypothetical protein [Romboutsia sedimentorum]MDK2562409.1 hypothetical protein [Romboutsia sedimentorum]